MKCLINEKDAAIAGVEILASVALFHYCTWIIGPGIETPTDALAYLAILSLSGLYVLLKSLPGGTKPLVLSFPRPDLKGIVIFPAITLINLAAFRLTGLETDPVWGKFFEDAAKYTASAAVQVIWLYLFLFPRLCRMAAALFGASRLIRDGSVCLALTAIFTLNHLPNPLLMICTGGIGLVWTCAYLHYPNPYLLTLSHAVLASGYIHLLGGCIRVGAGFLNPDHHAFNNSLRLITQFANGVF
jgi:hypothetical protein